jgi:hypothetical protein
MNKLTSILIGAVVSLLTGLGLQFAANYKLNSDLTTSQSIITEKEAIITYTTNKLGEEIATKNAVVGSLKAINAGYEKDIKALKSQLGIKSKELQSFTKISTETKGSGTSTINFQALDSLTTSLNPCPSLNGAVSIRTKWFDEDVIIEGNAFNYQYSSRDSLTFSSYQRKRKVYITGISENPDSHITGITNVSVHDIKNKRFGIGPSLQVIYLNGFKVVPGIGVQYNIIKF